MNTYDQYAYFEMGKWQHKMVQQPSLLNNLAKRLQHKLNSYLPEKVHKVITTALKQMFRVVLFGAELTTAKPLAAVLLEEREKAVLERVKFYKKTAAAEGGITGAAGILLGLADFPILFVIKIKLLFEIAALYGFDVKDYKERLYILYIFQLAFCSQETRKLTYLHITDWRSKAEQLPNDVHQFDWRTFQQEYRDYIDIAKMAQLVPVIGAPVGVVVNYRLIIKLGKTAMNAYRMRVFETRKLPANEPLLIKK